jgi:hypothetical protein
MIGAHIAAETTAVALEVCYSEQFVARTTRRTTGFASSLKDNASCPLLV